MSVHSNIVSNVFIRLPNALCCLTCPKIQRHPCGGSGYKETEIFLRDWSPTGHQSVLKTPIYCSCYTINLWNRFREQEMHKHCVHLHNDVFETNRSSVVMDPLKESMSFRGSTTP